ncbi:MAG: DUF2378 family protein [Myxococcota bacterium]
MESVQAQHVIFEGLFVRALRVKGGLKDTLKRCGFDADAPRPSYPMATWEACLDAACAELHPEKSREEGIRELGRRFTQGYFETLVGRMISQTLPFLSPKSFVARIPQFVETGLKGATIDVRWEDASTALLTMHGSGTHGTHLLAGVVEAALLHLRVAGRVEATIVSPDTSTMRIALTWGDRRLF